MWNAVSPRATCGVLPAASGISPIVESGWNQIIFAWSFAQTMKKN
jgi:hypothetical protein